MSAKKSAEEEVRIPEESLQQLIYCASTGSKVEAAQVAEMLRFMDEYRKNREEMEKPRDWEVNFKILPKLWKLSGLEEEHHHVDEYRQIALLINHFRNCELLLSDIILRKLEERPDYYTLYTEPSLVENPGPLKQRQEHPTSTGPRVRCARPLVDAGDVVVLDTVLNPPSTEDVRRLSRVLVEVQKHESCADVKAEVNAFDAQKMLALLEAFDERSQEWLDVCRGKESIERKFAGQMLALDTIRSRLEQELAKEKAKNAALWEKLEASESGRIKREEAWEKEAKQEHESRLSVSKQEGEALKENKELREKLEARREEVAGGQEEAPLGVSGSLTPKQKSVMDYLKDHGNTSSLADIARNLKIDRSNCNKILKALAKRGVLKDEGGGVYSLP